MDEKYEQVKRILKKYDQEHLLVCYDKLETEQKQELLNQILTIDFDLMKKLYDQSREQIDFGQDKIEPIAYEDKSKMSQETYHKYQELGRTRIQEGKLATVTMAGGQGTRLGHNGPKGTFDLGLQNHKSLFEILCDTLKEAKEKYGVYISWYIMTSNQNYEQTKNFFEQNNYFDYPKEKITFFIQGELPMLGEDGKILIGEDGLVKLAADGHGGTFEAIVKSGAYDKMLQDGIEWIFIGGVDNVLVKMVDPVLMGLAETKNCLAAGKSVVKAGPEERVGVFCTRNGKPSVIEYTEISEEMANARDEKGELVYGESHILCNLFNIKRITKIAQTKLPYHSAFKKASYIDQKGEKIVPDKPNAYKYEAFIFDAFSSLDSMAIMRVKREEEFAPVKNATGVDSPETARKLYKEFHEKKKGC